MYLKQNQAQKRSQRITSPLISRVCYHFVWQPLWIVIMATGIFLNANNSQAYTDITTYAWSERLVIATAKDETSDLISRVETFFAENACAVKERNLLFLSFRLGTEESQKLPLEMQRRAGLWLVGYDGAIKDYSPQAELLARLFSTIDEMPMRKQEMANLRSNC